MMNSNTPQIDCFIPYISKDQAAVTIQSLKDSGMVNQIFLLSQTAVEDAEYPVLVSPSLYHSETLRQIASAVSSPYFMIYFKEEPLKLVMGALNRLVATAVQSRYSWVYSDYYAIENGQEVAAPLIDCQVGSVRDDFDFGAMVLVNSAVLVNHLNNPVRVFDTLEYAAWYDFRLWVQDNIYHLAEKLYVVLESDLRKSGEKQFDYVDPRNRSRQIEMEKVFLTHLVTSSKWLIPGMYDSLQLKSGDFKYEASVVIPVRNRARTIADAIESVLGQETDFPFNLLIVDNYSTDGTSEIIEKYTGDKRVKHIIPEDTHLGIGGCWNRALLDEDCGRFAVQLDSDDLYSSPATLQKVVDKFYEENCAMVIGSYRMCNFQLETLPPGMIDHKEWTENNGRNNALRINGLGAPRAFYTPIAREMLFPNTSYGEDYAMGLAISSRYRIGRIYDELYLCRRWEGNSDAALSREKVNANNFYKDSIRTAALAARRNKKTWMSFTSAQLAEWPEAMKRYLDLWYEVKTRSFQTPAGTLAAQFNPARMVSTGAKMEQVKERACFLCKENRPTNQFPVLQSIVGFDVLINPYPILPVHFTVPSRTHSDQFISGEFGNFQMVVRALPDMVTFYNGPRCGASAPDHLHFQCGAKHILPLIKDFTAIAQKLQAAEPVLKDENTTVYLYKDYFYPMLVVVNPLGTENAAVMQKLYDILPVQEGEPEPGMNLLSWTATDTLGCEEAQITVIIPRKKHRPDCYFAENEEDKLMVSPGSLDMAGLLITPRQEDFEKLTAEKAVQILQEVTYTNEEIESTCKNL
ncbi:MAG: DUF4922 domain-containing protein [Bacteroidaceae bacterium]|nr:DUF4922 domain-containing protein [Bacteroidaceae bacterium]